MNILENENLSDNSEESDLDSSRGDFYTVNGGYGDRQI